MQVGDLVRRKYGFDSSEIGRVVSRVAGTDDMWIVTVGDKTYRDKETELIRLRSEDE